MTRWEYMRVTAQVKEPYDDQDWEYKQPGRILSAVHQAWTDRLNELGADGWELIQYEFLDDARARPRSDRWAAYVGMMKRPVSD